MKHILGFLAMWIGGSIALALIVTLLPVAVGKMGIGIISIYWLIICFVISFVLYLRREGD